MFLDAVWRMANEKSILDERNLRMKKQQDSSEVNVIFESDQRLKSRDSMEVYKPLTPSRVNAFQIVVCSSFKSSQCYSQMK